MRILASLYRFFSSWVGVIILFLFLISFVAQGFIIPSRSMVGSLYEGDMMFVKKFSYGVPTPKIPFVEIPILPDFFGNKHLIAGSGPKRGDLVVFHPPGDDKTYYIKRNFAVGGDKIIFTRHGIYLRPFEGDSYIEEHFKGYHIDEFFGEKYVKEPYSREHIGIHYGEKDGRVEPFSSYEELYYRYISSSITNNHIASSRRGIAMTPMEYNGDMIFYREVDKDSYFMVGDNRDNSEDSRFWGVVDYSRIIGQPWFTYFSITLKDSIESQSQEEKNRYKIRWNRIFKSVSWLESHAEKFRGEYRYYDHVKAIDE